MEKSLFITSPPGPANAELRTGNPKLTTGFLCPGLIMQCRVAEALRADLHNLAWILLASVLKSDTPCNS